MGSIVRNSSNEFANEHVLFRSYSNKLFEKIDDDGKLDKKNQKVIYDIICAVRSYPYKNESIKIDGRKIEVGKLNNEDIKDFTDHILKAAQNGQISFNNRKLRSAIYSLEFNPPKLLSTEAINVIKQADEVLRKQEPTTKETLENLKREKRKDIKKFFLRLAATTAVVGGIIGISVAAYFFPPVALALLAIVLIVIILKRLGAFQ